MNKKKNRILQCTVGGFILGSVLSTGFVHAAGLPPSRQTPLIVSSEKQDMIRCLPRQELPPAVGGQLSTPNARDYGYFEGKWRRWPTQQRMDKTFPQSIGATPIRPAAKRVVQEPVSTPATQENTLNNADFGTLPTLDFTPAKDAALPTPGTAIPAIPAEDSLENFQWPSVPEPSTGGTAITPESSTPEITLPGSGIPNPATPEVPTLATPEVPTLTFPEAPTPEVSEPEISVPASDETERLIPELPTIHPEDNTSQINNEEVLPSLTEIPLTAQPAIVQNYDSQNYVEPVGFQQPVSSLPKMNVGEILKSMEEERLEAPGRQSDVTTKNVALPQMKISDRTTPEMVSSDIPMNTYAPNDYPPADFPVFDESIGTDLHTPIIPDTYVENTLSPSADIQEIPYAMTDVNANLPPQRVAMEGFCPVTLLESETWTEGSPLYTLPHEGKTYRFSSAACMEAFRANPQRYVPVMEGCDPVLMSEGKQIHGLLDFCIVYQGRLYMFATEDSMNRFYENAAEFHNYTLSTEPISP
ncbi:MAG: hypothetical protein Q4C96_09105 [Planctomycetia bacterium]|nr:hypothetical protein [Planctomycetia bacterium]